MQVTVTGDALFSGWIDFDGNGSFDEPEIFHDEWLTVGAVHTLDFDVPADAAVGMTYARFRISTAGGLRAAGGISFTASVLKPDQTPLAAWTRART